MNSISTCCVWPETTEEGRTEVSHTCTVAHPHTHTHTYAHTHTHTRSNNHLGPFSRSEARWRGPGGWGGGGGEEAEAVLSLLDFTPRVLPFTALVASIYVGIKCQLGFICPSKNVRGVSNRVRKGLRWIKVKQPATICTPSAYMAQCTLLVAFLIRYIFISWTELPVL